MPPLASCRGGTAFKTKDRLTAAPLLRFAFRLDSGTEKERLRATVQEAMEKEQRCGVERWAKATWRSVKSVTKASLFFAASDRRRPTRTPRTGRRLRGRAVARVAPSRPQPSCRRRSLPSTTPARPTTFTADTTSGSSRARPLRYTPILHRPYPSPASSVSAQPHCVAVRKSLWRPVDP